MALHLHRAERTDLLADGLVALLADPLPDPFAEELVLVPARGVERWLSQRLSHVLGCGRGADGVCAGVAFRNPQSLIAEITGTVDDDPWSPDAMTWPLLEVIDCSLDEPWCRTLAAHLGHFHIGDEADLRRGRRYSVARRLAGLFASYARQRPQLLIDWLDGNPGDLDTDLLWQPELWRALVATVPVDPPHIRHQNTIARLREGPSDLPQRLSLFGHTRLARTDIELLQALSTHHDLHLWLPHPSDALWQALQGIQGAIPRRDDTSHRCARHPLLATLGRDLRELQRSLPTDLQSDEYLGDLRDQDRPNTLLGWLQSDIAANAVRPQGRKFAADDRSVQVHNCHGPARQVDVLREALLALLQDDPTLEPRDILVMCPDIETYAPLIVADFGLGDVVHGAHPAHRLRVKLADRSLIQTNPLLGVASQLLALAGSRATASEVLNLAQAPPIRARFGFTDDDLEAMTRWVRQANIRWGFDQEHRRPYHVDFVHNTWRFGIDRILAGVAMSDDSHAWIDATLPLDDVSSNRVQLAGQFAEFVGRLQHVVDSLTGARPLREWLAALTDGITRLTRIDDSDSWQTSQMQREFAEVLAQGSRADTALRLPDIRALLGRHLSGRPTRANFRTGTLTVCTMVPMRSVPHRVVCLVGLDDGVFPRLGVVDGDDVLARNPMTGERDIRSEDRQLLLDAIAAATEKLVITYTGANEYSGQPRPPAVPLAELLDTLDMTVPSEKPNKIRKRVVVEHPLQPFDVRNVIPGKLVPKVPFSFDPTVLRAARVSTGEHSEQPKFISGPLPPPPRDDVILADLVGFFKDPVKGFFRALEFTLPRDVDGVQDAMPVDINNLEEWTVGDRMLGDILRGMTPDDARQAEWRRGTLPPGQLGWRKATEIRDQAALLAISAQQHRSADAQAYDVDIDLGSGRRLTGTVSPVYGERLVSVTYSKLDGRHLLESWIPLLTLISQDPCRDWSAVCIGRPKRGTTVRVEGLGRPHGPDHQAVEVLRELVAIYDAGRREPIPLPIKTSYAWAAARHCGDDPVPEAQYRWKSGERYPGEDQAPAHVRAWGKNAPLADLMQPLRPGEEYDGEDNRLGAYAARLWLPMLRAERTPT
jgi:exodeoxyribonuclease V gamma subunit